MKTGHERVEELKLGDAISALLNECRMILPGIQALFGFQLIAVLQPPFFDKLTHAEQIVHILALGLVAISGAIVMAPAAYHRQAAPREASDGFIQFASWLLLIAMIPLMLGITLDFYLVAKIVLVSRALSALLAIIIAAIFIFSWYVMPHMAVFQRITGKER